MTTLGDCKFGEHGLYRLHFRFVGRRHSLTLAKTDEAAAILATEHVDHLIEQHQQGRRVIVLCCETMTTLSLVIYPSQPS